jgi:ArsR family transcriptional regulator, arsenate/arsenite/antimonite-responsive transcriptional repressor
MDRAELSKISKALADPTRLRIYEKIAAHPDTICGALVEDFGLSPATVSHHLRVLSEAGLIETRREGQFIHNCALVGTLKKYTQSLAAICHRSKTERKR